jgi:hypothetical protein
VDQPLGELRRPVALLGLLAQAQRIGRHQPELRGDEHAVDGDEEEAYGERDERVDGDLS